MTSPLPVHTDPHVGIFAVMGKIGWRTWLGITSGLFIVVGALTLLDLGSTTITQDGAWWAVAWLPSGLAGLVLAALNRPPRAPVLYSGIPTLFALGAVGRALGLYVVGSWVGGVSWTIVTWLIAWGWGRAMAPPAHDGG